MWPATNMRLTSPGDSGLKVLRKMETRFLSIPEEKYVAARSLSHFGLRSYKLAAKINFMRYEEWDDIRTVLCRSIP
jgi:hypothetical protein